VRDGVENSQLFSKIVTRPTWMSPWRPPAVYRAVTDEVPLQREACRWAAERHDKEPSTRQLRDDSAQNEKRAVRCGMAADPRRPDLLPHVTSADATFFRKAKPRTRHATVNASLSGIALRIKGVAKYAHRQLPVPVRAPRAAVRTPSLR
jgi:hypothetical protein